MKKIGDFTKEYEEKKRQSTPVDNPLVSENSIRELSVPQQSQQIDFFDDGRVRPEINFAKYADRIFLAPQSKKLYETRTISWQQTLFDDNESYPAEILIEPVNGRKTGTTTTYKVFLGLIRLWEQRGKPVDGKLVFSSRELASILNLQVSGQTAARLKESLNTLSGVRYTWKWSFTDKEGDHIGLVEEMHMLSSSTYVGKKYRRKEENFDTLHSITFHELILKNLLAGRTKPVNFEAFLAIPNGASSALYMRLDIIMASRSHYERRAQKLLLDLEISGKRYDQKFARNAKLKEFVSALDGKELSSGKLALAIEETSDKSDWKIVARKIPRKVKNRFPRRPLNPKLLRDDLVSLILDTVGQSDRARLWELFAATYPQDLIRRAVSEYRNDAPEGGPTSPGRFFVAIVHRLAHLDGKDWIKDCGSNCKWRPENQLVK